MREDHNRPTPRMTRHVWPAALAGVLLLSACQTSRIGGGEKEQIKNSLRGFQNAINARSFDQLDPVLSAEVQVDGLPGEMSRAGLKAGLPWTPSRVEGIQILSATKSPQGVETKVVLCMGRNGLPLKIGFDPAGKIRSIDADPLWKPEEASVPAAFSSRFVVSGGLLFVKATVDNKTGYFLFDTGSSHLLFNKKYFTANTEPGLTGISASIHGLKQPGGLVQVRSLRWEGLRTSNQIGELHDFSHMERPAVSPLLGAISHAEVKNLAVAFDGKRKIIQVHPVHRDGSRSRIEGEPPPTAIVPFTYFLHLPNFTARIGGKDVPLLFDSGAQMNLLPDLAGLENHFRPFGELRGLSDGGEPQKVAAVTGAMDRLSLGAVTYRWLPFVIHPLPYFGGKGMLGVPLFQQSRMEINFPARRILLWQ